MLSPPKENVVLIGAKATHDANAKSCYQCKTIFSKIIRRHNCRACGKVFCGACSSKEMLLIDTDKENKLYQKSFKAKSRMRICEKCSQCFEIVKESTLNSSRGPLLPAKDVFGVLNVPHMENAYGNYGNMENRRGTIVLECREGEDNDHYLEELLEENLDESVEHVMTPCFLNDVCSPPDANFQDVYSPAFTNSTVKSSRLSLLNELMTESAPISFSGSRPCEGPCNSVKEEGPKAAIYTARCTTIIMSDLPPMPSAQLSGRLLCFIILLIFAVINVIYKDRLPIGQTQIVHQQVSESEPPVMVEIPEPIPSVTSESSFTREFTQNDMNMCIQDEYEDFFLHDKCLSNSRLLEEPKQIPVSFKVTKGLRVQIKDTVDIRQSESRKKRFWSMREMIFKMRSFAMNVSFKNIARGVASELSIPGLDTDTLI